MANIDDFRKKSVNELRKQLAEARKELAELQISSSIGRLKDYSQVRKTKKRIARLLTVINEKEK